MNIFQRIFGSNRQNMPTPADFIQFVNEGDNERVRMTMSQNPNALAARWNAAMIYGHNNIPDTLGMVPVVEVKDKSGKWQPVTGSNRVQFDVETQLGALSSYRETGIIGPQPVKQTAGAVGTAGTGSIAGPTPGSIGAVPNPNGLTFGSTAAGLTVEDIIGHAQGVDLSYGLPAANVTAMNTIGSQYAAIQQNNALQAVVDAAPAKGRTKTRTDAQDAIDKAPAKHEIVGPATSSANQPPTPPQVWFDRTGAAQFTPKPYPVFDNTGAVKVF